MSRYKHMTINGVVYQAHRVIWEEAHGPIPEGFDIHHKDNDPHNNDLSNLMCLSHADHLALHAKLRAEGNVDNPTAVVIKDRANLKASYEANRENRLVHQKEYYEKNKDTINEKSRQRRKDNPEKTKESDRRHYLKRKDAVKEYRATHRELINAQKRRNYDAHREEICAWHRWYNAKQSGKPQEIIDQRYKEYLEIKAKTRVK